MSKNTGGFAFPYSFYSLAGHPRYRESQGMTLRDAFAIGVAADVFGHFSWRDEDIQKAAAMTWKLADALLAERDQ